MEIGQVTLYIKSWCPWCIEAVGWMKTRGLDFRQVDVESDEAGYARMRRISGQSLTPTLEMPDGGVLADFDTGQLEQYLKGIPDAF